VSGVSRGDLDQHAPAFFADLVGAKGLVSGRREGLTRAEAKMRPMSWAYDFAGFHFCLSKRLAVVRATVFYGVYSGPAAYDNDGDAVDLCREGYPLTDGLAAADIDPL
jgi:hypothetical protein